MSLKGALWRKMQENRNSKQEHKHIGKELEKEIDDQTDYLMKELRSIQGDISEYKYNTNAKIKIIDRNLNVLNKLLQKTVKQNQEIASLLKKKRRICVQI